MSHCALRKAVQFGQPAKKSRKLQYVGNFSLALSMGRRVETHDSEPGFGQRFNKYAELRGSPRPSMHHPNHRPLPPTVKLNFLSLKQFDGFLRFQKNLMLRRRHSIAKGHKKTPRKNPRGQRLRTRYQNRKKKTNDSKQKRRFNIAHAQN